MLVSFPLAVQGSHIPSGIHPGPDGFVKLCEYLARAMTEGGAVRPSKSIPLALLELELSQKGGRRSLHMELRTVHL